MPNQVIPVTGLDQTGVIKDTPPMAVPQNAFTDARNVRFKDGAVRKMEGEVELFNDADLQPAEGYRGDIKHIIYWDNPNIAPLNAYYVYIFEMLDTEASADGVPIEDRVFIQNVATKELRDVTPSTPFETGGDWQHTFFQGGFALVINNGIDKPHYIQDTSDNTDIDDIAKFAALPGWDSYYLDQTIIDDTFDEETNTRVFDAGQLVDFSVKLLSISVGDSDTDVLDNGTTNLNGGMITIDSDTETNTTIITFDSDSLPDGSSVTIKVESKNPLTVSAGVVRSFGDFLVAGDLVERDSDTQVAVRRLTGVVRTSDAAPPGGIPNNWNPFAAGVSTADETVVAESGKVVDLVQLQGSLYIYTASSIHAMRLTGNASVPTQIQPVTNQYGCLTTEAVKEYDGRHIVVGSNDIYAFGGHPGSIQSVADARVREYFYNNVNPLYETNMFLIRNQPRDEMWICYPTVDSKRGECDEALIWNYRNNTWTIRDLNGVASGDFGPIPGGGLPATTLALTGTSGNGGYTSEGEPETQVLDITGTVTNRHSGFGAQTLLDFSGIETPIVADDLHAVDLTIDNGVGTNAHPDLVHAVNTIDFAGATTPLDNDALAGGTRLVLNGTNGNQNNGIDPLELTIDTNHPDFGSYSNLDTYLNRLVTFINNDYIEELSDYTVTRSGNVLTFTSDVMGPRTFTSAELRTFSGTTVITSGTQGTSNEVTLTRSDGTLITGPSGSGNGNGNSGGITVTTATGPVISQPFSISNQIYGDGSISTVFVATGSGTVSADNSRGAGVSVLINGVQRGPGPVSFSAGQSIGIGGADGNPGSDDPVAWTATLFGSQNVASTNITFTNNNSYPVTFTSGPLSGTTIQPGNSATATGQSSAAWSFTSSNIQQYNWTFDNNRTGLDADLYNVMVTVGSDTLDFGNIEGGAAPVVRTTTQSNDNATWTAQRFSITSQAFNQNTADATTTSIGPITITRTQTTAIPTSFVPDTANLVPQDGTADWTIPRSQSGGWNLATYVQGYNGLQFTNPGHTQPTITGTYTVATTGDVYFVVVGGGGGGAEWFGAGGSGGGGAGIYGRIPNVSQGTVLSVGAGGAGTGKCSSTSNNGGGDSYITGPGINIRAGGGGGTGHPENAGPGGVVGSTIGAIVIHSLNGTAGENGAGVPNSVGTAGGMGYFTQRGATEYRFRNGGSYSNWVHGTDHSWGDGGRGVQCGNSGAPGIVFIWQQSGYNYTATVAANNGPATITSADGVGQTTSLTPGVSSSIRTGTLNHVINVQGTYSVVSGTVEGESDHTATNTVEGNGVYGIANADAPSIGIRILHTGSSVDNFTFAPFTLATDTLPEYRDSLFTSMRSFNVFNGLDPATTDPGDQPDGAEYYINLNGDAIRITALDPAATNSLGFEPYVEVNGDSDSHAAGTFGGGVDIQVDTITESVDGSPPPILDFAHESSGAMAKVVYYGTQADTNTVASVAYQILSALPGFTAVLDGDQITMQRNYPGYDSDTEVFTVVNSGDTDITLPTVSLAEIGSQPSVIEPTLTFVNPESKRTFDVRLEGIGEADGTSTGAEVAQFLLPILNDSSQVDLGNWVADTDDSDQLIFTAVAGIDHNNMRADSRRVVDSDWYFYVANYGDTGTEPEDFDSEQFAVVDSDGVDAEYSTLSRLTVIIQNGVDTDGNFRYGVFYDGWIGEGPNKVFLPYSSELNDIDSNIISRDEHGNVETLRYNDTDYSVEEYLNLWHRAGDTDTDIANGMVVDTSPILQTIYDRVNADPDLGAVDRLPANKALPITQFNVVPLQFSAQAAFIVQVYRNGIPVDIPDTIPDVANDLYNSLVFYDDLDQGMIAPTTADLLDGVGGTDHDLDWQTTDIERAFDPFRPWKSNQLNPSKQFLIFGQNEVDTDGSRIRAADISYKFGDSDYESFVERTHLPLTPEFTTEMLHSIALWADGGTALEAFDTETQAKLTVQASTINNPGARVMYDNGRTNMFDIAEDYKIDMRVTGRFMNVNISDKDQDSDASVAWDISGIQLEVGQGGKR